MTALDIAGLIVVAGRVLGIGTDAALAQVDIPAAQAALAEAAPPQELAGAAAVVIEALDCGRLTPAAAAGWRSA